MPPLIQPADGVRPLLDRQRNAILDESTSSIKYLGIIIDNFVSGEMVVNNILSKVNARLKFMYHHSSSLSSRARKKLCSAIILCHFDYSCSSWCAGLTKCLKKKIQIAQNKLDSSIL